MRFDGENFIKSLNISRRIRFGVDQFIKSFECQLRMPMIKKM